MNFSVLFSLKPLGLFVRFLFFSAIGRRKAFSTYYDDEYSSINLLIGVIIFIAVAIFIIIFFNMIFGT